MRVCPLHRRVLPGPAFTCLLVGLIACVSLAGCTSESPQPPPVNLRLDAYGVYQLEGVPQADV